MGNLKEEIQHKLLVENRTSENADGKYHDYLEGPIETRSVMRIEIQYLTNQ